MLRICANNLWITLTLSLPDNGGVGATVILEIKNFSLSRSGPRFPSHTHLADCVPGNVPKLYAAVLGG